jgi:hypothetical protein
MTVCCPLAWHYLTGENFMTALKAGRILPATLANGRSGKSAVWFSLNDAWAPIAEMLPPRRPFSKTKKENVAGLLAIVRTGYYRVGVDRSVCSLTWRQAMHGIGLTERIAAELYQTTGIEQRARPSEWCGALEPVEREQWRAIESFDSRAWTPLLLVPEPA